MGRVIWETDMCFSLYVCLLFFSRVIHLEYMNKLRLTHQHKLLILVCSVYFYGCRSRHSGREEKNGTYTDQQFPSAVYFTILIA